MYLSLAHQDEYMSKNGRRIDGESLKDKIIDALDSNKNISISNAEDVESMFEVYRKATGCKCNRLEY